MASMFVFGTFPENCTPVSRYPRRCINRIRSTDKAQDIKNAHAKGQTQDSDGITQHNGGTIDKK